MRPSTPRGFRDVLYDEAAERDAVSVAMADAAEAWGYRPLCTPVVEEARVLEAGVGGTLEGTAFRLVDLDGTLLALRPEMTVPVARVVASRLQGEIGPHRIRYAADVFREEESFRGQPRQFAQCGVELVGCGGPVADAEVIAVMVEVLAAAGLASYTVGLGSVGILRSLLDSSGTPERWRRSVTDAVHGRDYVELDRLADGPVLRRDVAAALRAVPRLRGGREAIEACRAFAVSAAFTTVLDDLDVTWRLLDAGGVSDHVMIDFGIMRSFDYYTGIVLEAYAPGLGLPLGGGGRYDGVLEAFEAPAPAAGFALGMERVMIALAEQGRVPKARGLDAVLGGDDALAVFEAARKLRGSGWRVGIAVGRTGVDVVRAARAARAEEALLAEAEGVVRLDESGRRSTALPAPFPSPRTALPAAMGGGE